MDTVFTVLAYTCGYGAALFIALLGILILASPKHALLVMVAFDRALRWLFYKGDWNFFEKHLPRRGQFFFPSDVELATPADMHRFLLSDRALDPPHIWVLRAWAVFTLALSIPALIAFSIALI